MYADPTAAHFSEPPTNSRPPKPKHDRPGRPRALDDGKRREICALIAGGCTFQDAARYVRCSVNTIRREAERNPNFGEQLRQSENDAKLGPLRAMQHAAGTHWRAAAWLLERMFPEAFGRRPPGIFGATEARKLMKEVVTIIHEETTDPIRASSIAERVRASFEYHILKTCDEVRDSRTLQHAMQFFETKGTSTLLADLLGPLAAGNASRRRRQQPKRSTRETT